MILPAQARWIRGRGHQIKRRRAAPPRKCWFGGRNSYSTDAPPSPVRSVDRLLVESSVRGHPLFCPSSGVER
jgi:hypothetical protein